jgi:peptidyl-prolyl cis-trans isomerase SurA
MQWKKRSLRFLNSLKSAGILLVIVLTGAMHANAQENTGFVVDEIIAKVDNYIVMKSDLEKAYQDYLTNGGTPGQEVRCQYMALLVRNKLMMAKAEIDSVLVLDFEVDQYTDRKMEMIIAQSGVTANELEEKYGKTLEQIRLEIRDQEREQMVVRKMQDEITKDVTVTPSDIKKFFNKIPKDSLPYFSAAVEAAQIVKVAKVNEEQKDVTRKQLMDIRDQILKGEDFATLAKKYSDDPSAKANGGSMGWVGRGKMVPEFEAMGFRLKPGEISMPFESQFGFHIMQLIERRGNEYNSRHILISPQPSPSDLKDAGHYLDSIRGLIGPDKMTFQKAAKEFSDDMATKGNGGFFTGADESMRVLVEELDPVVYFKLDSMKVGDISEPLQYRTDEGKSAMRIIFYKSRIRPHEASLEDDWTRIQLAALNEKKDRILQKWFSKARKDVFISIDKAYDYCGLLDD